MLNIKFLTAIIFIFLITACGGGSSTEIPEETNNTPIINIDDDPADDPADEDEDDNPNVANQPNILFIISDDQGLDASAQYSYSVDLPVTPTINTLAEQGIVFDNAWATPACTTTRATILTGKYGVNSGVNYVPAVLSTEHTLLQTHLKNNTTTQNYQSAVFGKWHVGGGNADASHPNDVGVDYYAGNLSNLTDYYDWNLTVNGITENSTVYHSTKITDLAIDWIAEKNTPWFAWVAYSAPHSPLHLPPNDLHERDLSGISSHITANRRDYYLAAIEAMDSEISRLLASLDEATRENTIIIYLGDNGTPANVIEQATYTTSHSKGSLYQGGVAVPLIVSGKGVTRINVRESALVTATDLYSTIAEIAGIDDRNIYDSNSFFNLFSTTPTNTENSGETHIYTEFESSTVTGWAVRSDNYKLIEFESGDQELYSLSDNFSETENLLPTSNNDLLAQVSALETVASNIIGLTNSPIDITNANLTNGSGNCADYVESFTSTVSDINNGTLFMGDLTISVVGDKCVFNTNAIPNHDFNDGGNAFPNNVSAQNDQFEITNSPTKASVITELSLRIDNAILLNGVKVDLLAAGCFGIGNGKIGCNDGNPWRYDPMHAANGFNVDSHNAHAQPDGTYHYHGSPLALFPDDNSSISPVVGFAADGFPIYGSYIDDSGNIRKVIASYQLKAGNRPSGTDEPGGSYDGSFRDDYEFVENLGDLDECNGMTVNGVYGYYITDTYPYVMGCYSGTPDSSFNK